MSTSPFSQRPSLFGAAAFRKAIDVVAHYVEFSDKSSSWSGSQSGDERTETPDNNKELRTPLLQSHPVPSDDSPESNQHTPRHSAQAEIIPADQLAQQMQNLAQMDVPRRRDHVDASSSSNDGTETPSKEDLRAPSLLSQPAEPETHTHGSPKVAATSGLEQLGSGLLDPSLLQRLLDDDAPLPEMPASPIRHVQPVTVPLNASHGMQHMLNDSAAPSNVVLVRCVPALQNKRLTGMCFHPFPTHFQDYAESWRPECALL